MIRLNASMRFSRSLCVKCRNSMDYLDSPTTRCFIVENRPCMPGHYLDHSHIALTEASDIHWVGDQDTSSSCVQINGPSLQVCSNIWRHFSSEGSL